MIVKNLTSNTKNLANLFSSLLGFLYSNNTQISLYNDINSIATIGIVD